jgi:tetratricopeptide (TPR) repeat protein
VTDYVEAEKFFDQAIAILRTNPTSDPRLLPVALTNQGRLYQETGRFALSESRLKEALRLTELKIGSQHRHMVQILNFLGTLYMSANKARESEMNFKKPLRLSKSSLVRRMDLLVRS